MTDFSEYIQTGTVRVRYSETDRMGIVYNANYLSWFEVARTELCRCFGTSYREWEEAGYMVPLIEAHCVYKSPARYDDLIKLFCRTPIESIKVHSIIFEYKIASEEGKLLAEGWTKHAFVNNEGKIYRKNNEFQEWLLAEALRYNNWA